MIITIDGTTSSGKRAVAQKVGKELGIPYCDSGALYRFVTCGILKKHIFIHNHDDLTAFLKDLKFEFKDEGEDRLYFFEGEDISDDMRMPDVTYFVTKIAAIPAVREKIAAYQRAQASAGKGKMVFAGRDLGTVVFPEAAIKVFITADPEVRARRRYRNLKTKFPEEYAEMTFEDVFEEITDRDDADMSREISPLKIPEGAEFIDTTDLTVDQVASLIISYKNSIV